MIARVGRGWTKAENADAYENLLREVVYPGLPKIKIRLAFNRVNRI